MKKILIISGPNLNMLGKRDETSYGSFTYKELKKSISRAFPKVKFKFYQSNHEGRLIDKLQRIKNFDGIVINPGGLTHTSVSLRDTLEIINIPIISVHLSNINEREEFRKNDLIKDVVDNVFMGEKINSYYKAINYLLDKI